MHCHDGIVREVPKEKLATRLREIASAGMDFRRLLAARLRFCGDARSNSFSVVPLPPEGDAQGSILGVSRT